ncbi:hypothetical protein [Stieleria sp.]|uniref:hypothetical protein n=1 Tax=Stieleria sp. TaxID=2795976 RepID=UPI003562DBBE
MDHWSGGPDAKSLADVTRVCFLPEASSMELRAVKLSFPMDPVGPSLMTQNRALHNPPIAVPSSGLPSHQNPAIETDYLLVCEAYSRSLTDGRWRFTLEAADGELILDAEDQELGDLNRLTLLAAVRGLESLEGPSAVTLLSNNRYLIRSLSNSLPRWRQNNFRWEHFGRRIDVQHADLWRRIDRTLAIHRVQACLVSSCLVSHGHHALGQDADLDPTTRSASVRLPRQSSPADPSHYRIDPPASQSRLGNLPNTAPNASQHNVRSSVPAPSRRLRRLINGDAAAPPTPSSLRRRGRFTAEDLESE